MYMAATTLANYVMTQRGGRDGGMFRCAALLSESLFPTDRAPKPLIHPIRCQSVRTDMEEFVKLRADAKHSGLPPASLQVIKGCSPVLIWATVLGGFRSYKCNGAKFAEEWTRLGRSIVSCSHVGLDDKECIITSVNHSRQLRSLGKSAELTCVQIAQLVVEMKDLMTADMLAEQSRAPPPGKKRKLKEITQEMLAKGFADQNAGDTGGKYRLSSVRVIRAYLKVADGFLTSQENYHTYCAMLEKWGPECVFHCSYAVEAILIGLGKEHKAQVPDCFGFLDLMFSQWTFQASKIAVAHVQGVVSDKTVETSAGLVHLYLMRHSTLELLLEYDVGDDIKDLFLDHATYLENFPTEQQVQSATRNGRHVASKTAWLSSSTGKRLAWKTQAMRLFNKELDSAFRAAFN